MLFIAKQRNPVLFSRWEKGDRLPIQDKCSLQQLGIDAPPCRSTCPSEIPQAALGWNTVVRVRPQFRGRGDGSKDEKRGRRKRKKRGKRSISQPLARENATMRGWLERKRERERERVVCAVGGCAKVPRYVCKDT